VPAPAPAPTTKNYTIQDGDMWTSIAAKFHTTPERLWEMNNVVDTDRILSGQTIKVPV
jgi:LysM repeat protein